MRFIKHLTTWLLLLTVITASGIVSAKVASGVQNLSGGLHQENVTANALLHLAKIDFSYDGASGFPLAPKSVGNFSRNISPSDLGVKGNLKELKGSFGVNDGVATARIDMIRGEIKNPLEIVSNLANTARSSGASSLKIEGTLANERLYNILSKRYGLTSQGAKDVITIPLQ